MNKKDKTSNDEAVAEPLQDVDGIKVPNTTTYVKTSDDTLTGIAAAHIELRELRKQLLGVRDRLTSCLGQNALYSDRTLADIANNFDQVGTDMFGLIEFLIDLYNRRL
jgi:hypothetical protein